MVRVPDLAGLSDNPPQIVALTQDKFDRGVISLIDQSKLPKNALKEADNLILAEDGAPTTRPGVDWYGTSLGSTLGALTSISYNLINNPSFEVNAAGWQTVLGGTTLTRITSDFRLGNASLQVTKAAAPYDGIYTTTSSNAANSTSYTLSAYIKAPLGLAYTYQLYHDTGIAAIGDGNAVGTGDWERVTVTGVTPAVGTLPLSAYIRWSTTDTVLVDAVMVEEGTSASTYFDGASSSSGADQYAWLGAAHNSPSTHSVYAITPNTIDGADFYVDSDDAVHLIVVANGVIYRSLNDGLTWAACTGATLTPGKKVHFEQANSYLFIFNEWDNIVRYGGTTTLSTYTALSTPSGNAPTKTGLAGTTYTYYYRVSAVNDIGYTLASTPQSIQVDRTRDQFDASNFVTFTWSTVAGAIRYDIYVGQTSGEEVYIASVEGQTTNSYADKTNAVEQVAIIAPESNTTQGPRVGDIALIGTRLYATRDRDFPYRVWISGAGRYIGYFSSAYDATYIDLQKGGQYKPVKVEDYRDGKGTPLATVWCKSKDGRGCIWQGTLESFTVGDVTFPVPNFYKLPGSRGTDAPDSIINVLNDYMYYNSQAIYNLGSRAQFLNLLSTDEASANIRPDIKRIRQSASNKIAAHFQDAKVYLSVPYNSDENNATAVFDSERKAWLPRAFDIGFERFFDYTDVDGDRHLLCWKPGDTQLSEISDSIKGDYGVAFMTSLVTGLLHVNPRNRFEFMWCEEGEVEFALPQGEISIELSAITREDGFRAMATRSITPSTTKYSWTTHTWGDHPWTDTTVAIVSYSEPSAKRFFEVSEDINAYQYRITTSSLNASYILRTLQINGTPTQAGKPREWELYE